MAVPAMFIPPVVMSRLEKTATFIKNPWLKAPATVLLTGFCLTFSTPLCCALFPQKASIQLKDLDPELQQVKSLQYTLRPLYMNTHFNVYHDVHVYIYEDATTKIPWTNYFLL